MEAHTRIIVSFPYSTVVNANLNAIIGRKNKFDDKKIIFARVCI